MCQCYGYSSVPQPISSFDLEIAIEFAIGFVMKIGNFRVRVRVRVRKIRVRVRVR